VSAISQNSGDKQVNFYKPTLLIMKNKRSGSLHQADSLQLIKNQSQLSAGCRESLRQLDSEKGENSPISRKKNLEKVLEEEYVNDIA